jgi:hypothetical protein
MKAIYTNLHHEILIKSYRPSVPNIIARSDEE